MIPQTIGNMNMIFLYLIMERIDISLLCLIVCHRNASPCKSPYFEVSSRSWRTSSVYQKKKKKCFLEQFPDYYKQVSEIRKISSCKIFPPFVIIFRYFVLFLDVLFLKGKDCSCFNNNFRLNLMKVKKKKGSKYFRNTSVVLFYLWNTISYIHICTYEHLYRCIYLTV